MRGLGPQDRDFAEHDPASVNGTLPLNGRDTGPVDERERTGRSAAVLVCRSGAIEPAGGNLGQHGIDRKRYGGARAEGGPQLTTTTP